LKRSKTILIPALDYGYNEKAAKNIDMDRCQGSAAAWSGRRQVQHIDVERSSSCFSGFQSKKSNWTFHCPKQGTSAF